MDEKWRCTQEVLQDIAREKENVSRMAPSKTIFIAAGIGIGIGLLLSASSSHRSRTCRITQPVTKVLTKTAHVFWRH